MKTKDSIHRLCAAALLSAAALVTVAFSSCSSDDAPNPIPDVPATDGMATINLSFAAPTIESRTDGKARVYTDENGESYDPVDTKASEDKIHSLWIYFFEVTSNGSKLWKAFDVATTSTATADYTSMSLPGTISTDAAEVIKGINIPKGTYKIYTLANIDGYETESDEINPDFVNVQNDTYKAALESKLLNYTFETVNANNNKLDANNKPTGNDQTGIISGNLPMGAHYTDVTLSASAGSDITQNADKTIKIESGSGTITASLTYLCAKVRYTIFFDNTVTRDDDGNATSYGYSYPINTFEYEVIGVHNALEYAALFPDHFDYDNKTFPRNISIKNIIDDPEDPTKGCVASEYPSADDLKLWLDKEVNTSQKSLTALGAGAAKPTTGQIAYQGLIYLPENRDGKSLSSDEDLNTEDYGNKTCLHLKAKIDGDLKDFIINLPDKSEGTSAATLTHGTFYDVVAKITSTGAEFNVKVKKWMKSTNSISKPI